MPKLDEAKERLGLLKFWLGIFVATFIAIGGWCATNYKIFQDTIPLFVLAAFAEIILLSLIKYTNSKIKLILKEIRDLKNRSFYVRLYSCCNICFWSYFYRLLCIKFYKHKRKLKSHSNFTYQKKYINFNF